MVMGLMMIINQAVDGGKENQFSVFSFQFPERRPGRAPELKTKN